MATGPVGKEPKLLLLDPVLHLATGTVDVVIDRLRFALEAGHHKARVAPLVTVLGFSDDPPRPIPGRRRVVQPAKESLLVLALRVVRGGLLQKFAGQDRVTSSLRIAGACRAASMLLGRR